ncbi:MAG: dockerin type I repeat-containing protein, partial [Oscillospiraceae bacterium]
MKKFKSAMLIIVSLVMLFSFTVVSFASEGLQIKSDSETYLRGDVTMSGDLEIQDIVLIRSYIVGNYELSSKQILISDVNMDTEIDITDIILIRAHIVGDSQIKETISFKDESSTSSSTSTSTTTKAVYDNEPISVLLEAEEAASNGEIYEGNDSAASSGKYAILTKDSGLTFTLPENATTGYYDIIIIAKDDNGEFTADILTDSTLIDKFTIGSDYWNTYVYNEIVIQTGEKLTIYANDDGVQIDCVLISSKNSTVPSSSTTSTSASTTSTSKSSTSTSTSTSTSKSTTTTSKSTTSTSPSTTSTSKSTTSTSK